MRTPARPTSLRARCHAVLFMVPTRSPWYGNTQIGCCPRWASMIDQAMSKHAPRAADWTRESHPSSFEFGHIALRPPQQCRMRDGESTFSHYFLEIAIRELIRDVPPHAQDDELLLEV